MADIVDNRVEVSGSKSQIKKFIKLMGEDFNFNRIIPMPEELRQNNLPTMPQEMSDRLKTEYGYDNWYDWAIKNWGVKGVPSNVVVEKEDDSVAYEFQTPWGPPEPVYDMLMEMFPDLSIECYYHRFEWESV